MLKCHFALKWWKEKYKNFCIQIYRDKNIEKSQPVSYSNWIQERVDRQIYNIIQGGKKKYNVWEEGRIEFMINEI